MVKSNAQINKEATSAPLEDSPAVIAYRMGQLENAVKAGFEKHDKKLDSLTSNFATKEEFSSINTRVTSLESDRKWLARLVIGAVLFALLSLIGVGFKVLGKS